MDNARLSGKFGEQFTCRYLQQQGYIICYRNVKVGFDEIDIVAEKHSCLFAFEVRFRKENCDFIEAFPYYKQYKFARAVRKLTLSLRKNITKRFAFVYRDLSGKQRIQVWGTQQFTYD